MSVTTSLCIFIVHKRHGLDAWETVLHRSFHTHAYRQRALVLDEACVPVNVQNLHFGTIVVECCTQLVKVAVYSLYSCLLRLRLNLDNLFELIAKSRLQGLLYTKLHGCRAGRARTTRALKLQGHYTLLHLLHLHITAVLNKVGPHLV